MKFRRSARLLIWGLLVVGGAGAGVALTALLDSTAGGLPAMATSSTPGPTCTINWVGPSAGGSWTTASNWSPARVPTTTDFACIPSSVTGTVTISTGTNVVEGVSAAGSGGLGISSSGTLELTSDPSTVTNLTMSAGYLQVDAGNTLSLAGNSGSWSGGALQGAGTTTLPSGATLTLAGGTEYLDGHQVFDNAGTVNMTSGGFCLGQGATFTNTGTFSDTSNNNYIQWCTGSNAPVFANAAGGTLKTQVSGTAVMDVPFSNAGAVDVNQGTFETAWGDPPGTTDTGSYTVASGATLLVNDQRTLATGASVTGGTLRIGSSATLTLNGQTFGTVAQTGGTTDGSYKVTGTDTWSGGSMAGSGTTTIASGATLDLTGGTPDLTGGHTLANSGTVHWTSGNFCIDTGAVFDNSATFSAAPGSNVSLYECNTGSPGRFDNLAGATTTASVPSADTLNMQVPFDNAGTVTVSGGNFETEAGNAAGATDSGSYAVAAGATMTVDDQRTLTSAATIATTGNGTLDIANGALLSLAGQTIGNVTQTGGSEYGSFTVSGTYTWSGGTLGQSGTTTLASTGTLALSGGTLEQHSFVNDGTATWTSGNFCIGGGATFNNAAGSTFNADASSASIYNCGAPLGLFTVSAKKGTTAPAAVLNVASAPNGVTIDVPFNNLGSTSLNSGSLQTQGGNSAGAKDSGSYTLKAGTTFFVNDQRSLAGKISGSGVLELQGSANVTFKSQQIANLDITGGAATGPFTATGTFSWSGGTVYGASMTLGTKSTTTISGSVNIFGPKVAAEGTIDWNAGYIQLCDGTIFTNKGTFKDSVAADYGIYSCGGDSDVPEFINSKAFTVSSPSGSYISAPFDNTKTVSTTSGWLELAGGNVGGLTDTGSYSLAAGTTLYVEDYRTFAKTATVTGAGTLDVAGSATLFLNGQSLGTVVQTSGYVIGAFTVTGSLDWSAGWEEDLPGTPTTTTIASGATVNVTGSVQLAYGHTLLNKGTIDWSAGSFCVGAGAVLDNAGIVNANAAGYSVYNCESSDSTTPRVLNAAGSTWTASTSGNDLYLSNGVTFDNLGAVDVTAGTFQLNGSNSAGSSDTGSYVLSSGTILLIDNQRTLGTGATVTGAGTLELYGNDLTFSGQSIPNYEEVGGLSYGPFTVTGTMSWTGGYMDDSGTPGTTTTIANGATLSITSGSPELAGDHTILNKGTIDLDGGNLYLCSGAALDNTGTFNLESNNGVYTCGGPNTTAQILNKGILADKFTGTSAIQVQTTNEGTIDMTEGILQFGGSYGQDLTEPSTGTIEVVIDGPSAGTGFGQVQVGSIATLAGTLDVVTHSGFTPTTGQSFQIITAGTLVGTFSTVNTTSGFAPGYSISYNRSASPPNVTATAK